MARYAVAGRTPGVTNTLDLVAYQLWNPHASISLFVREIHHFKSAATADNLKIVRTTTSGTPGSTVTPLINNHFGKRYAHISVALLYLAVFSVQPTLAGPEMFRIALPAAIGAGIIWVFPEPIEIPAGTGLGVAVPEAGAELAITAADVSFVWDE